MFQLPYEFVELHDALRDAPGDLHRAFIRYEFTHRCVEPSGQYMVLGKK